VVSRVQSIERAFAVLGGLTDGPSGVTDLAARVGLPKSTVARLLSALVSAGAVEQVPGDTRYRVGSRIVSLAANVLPTGSLVAIARPDLAGLAAAVGEAAGLSVPDGVLVHYIDQVDTPNPVQVRDWTGTRVPMHAVSSGQVLLAQMPPAALERFIARPLDRFTSHTLVDAPALRERLRRILKDGYGWVREEFDEGISSVAAAIADQNGEFVAAVHVHGPSYRFPRAGSEDEIGARVLATAASISARIRHSSGSAPRA
jgi:IclR family acetate operon transcriptional repressor